MISLLEEAFQKVQTLSPERQEEVARMLLDYAGGSELVHQLTPEEIADLDEADGEIARGEIATDEEIRAVLAKHGL